MKLYNVKATKWTISILYRACDMDSIAHAEYWVMHGIIMTNLSSSASSFISSCISMASAKEYLM